MKHSQLKVSFRKINFPPICSSGDSYRFLLEVWDKQLMDLQEQVYIIFLNGANEVISWRCLNTGTGDHTVFNNKLALACALGCMATKIIIAHNHPSGILKPSRSDIVITEKLAKACKLIDIQLQEHLIVSRAGYYSFVDNDIIKV